MSTRYGFFSFVNNKSKNHPIPPPTLRTIILISRFKNKLGEGHFNIYDYIIFIISDNLHIINTSTQS